MQKRYLDHLIRTAEMDTVIAQLINWINKKDITREDAAVILGVSTGKLRSILEFRVSYNEQFFANVKALLRGEFDHLVKDLPTKEMRRKNKNRYNSKLQAERNAANRTVRKCLKCDREFHSKSKQNRICENCKSNSNWRYYGT